MVAARHHKLYAYKLWLGIDAHLAASNVSPNISALLDAIGKTYRNKCRCSPTWDDVDSSVDCCISF